MPGLTPTAAAMRVAEQRMQTLGPNAQSESVKRGIANNIDQETGLPELIDALTQLQLVLAVHGDWEEGCFYYNGKSASELEKPIALARNALAIAREGRR